ncbi:putative C-S lyase [Brevibacillus sp. SYP-B805]|uniref:MalY/PatB family protein n=1 Tax=Brevibacillus sp. SYP-B805 TaxID=1578199 RepID=UPI0013EC82FD|nr:PatB family C-S lyase [Brevibacillus sp. SYP-B805]NGQ93790.1 putative C-S lyase [Brevibacillus sp. SYP-B805]
MNQLYDFDRVIPRRNTHSVKWDLMAKVSREPDLIPLWVADMDFPAPPEVVEAVTRRAELGIYGYAVNPDSYFEAVGGWMKRRHGWEIRQEWLVHAPGVIPAISMLVMALTAPGDRVVIQPPVYPPFFDVIRKNGREVVENPLVLRHGRYEMDFEDLERQLEAGAKMLILCSPHNPVGRVWTREELLRLSQLCLAHKVILVSDEIHSDLVYDGYRHIPAASLSEEIAMNTITCISVGKTFNLAGLQTANVIIPNAEWRRAYTHTLHALHLFIQNYFAGAAVVAAYTHGEAWLSQLMSYIRGNLDYLTDYLAKHMPTIKPVKPEGTYLVWLDCRELGMTAPEIKEWMYRKAKVALNEGSTFGKEGEGFLRINLACPRATLAEGLVRMERALKER